MGKVELVSKKRHCLLESSSLFFAAVAVGWPVASEMVFALVTQTRSEDPKQQLRTRAVTGNKSPSCVRI